MLAFLCGGMEYARDGGSRWRVRTRLWIQENLNHRVFDPTEEAKLILSEEELSNMAVWKRSDVERFRKVMRFIINHDLNVITSQADYIICFWDEAAARGGGTQAELTAAFRKGIPIYLVTESPMEGISGWVVACTDKIFATFEELRQFLTATYRKDARQR